MGDLRVAKVARKEREPLFGGRGGVVAGRVPVGLNVIDVVRIGIQGRQAANSRFNRAFGRARLKADRRCSEVVNPRDADRRAIRLVWIGFRWTLDGLARFE